MLDGHGARWILRADPEAGLEMLLQARPPLAPAAVLPILSAQVGSVTAATFVVSGRLCSSMHGTWIIKELLRTSCCGKPRLVSAFICLQPISP